MRVATRGRRFPTCTSVMRQTAGRLRERQACLRGDTFHVKVARLWLGPRQDNFQSHDSHGHDYCLGHDRRTNSVSAASKIGPCPLVMDIAIFRTLF